MTYNPNVPCTRRTHADLTPPIQAMICERIANAGDMKEAAQVANTTVSSIRARQERDPAFAAAIEQAWKDYSDLVVLPAIQQRAIHGVLRGVYYKGLIAKDENGKPVYERHYSDQLLLRLAEVLDHRFRPHTTQTINAKLGPAQTMDDLTPEQRKKLEAFLDSMPQPAESLQNPQQLPPPPPDDPTS